jgi:hypothetical protein
MAAEGSNQRIDMPVSASLDGKPVALESVFVGTQLAAPG